MNVSKRRALAWVVIALSVMGCESSDPISSAPLAYDAATEGGNLSCAADSRVVPRMDAECKNAPTDYTPRVEASRTDTWPACISDTNGYVPFSTSISSLTRVAAFEQIATILGFGTGLSPSPQAFLDARVLYSAEQGLESRVSRREDEHYPALDKLCRDMTEGEQAAHPDRCVGPARIRPLLNEAFVEGIGGKNPEVNAARIEAGLLWFFYVSIYKEATSARTNANDVDSMWAKYTGGEPRESSKGLSRYVKARSQPAHDRIWDGLLAVRCWRDLDNPSGPASDAAMQEQARLQLDRALLYGMASIVRQRAEATSCTAAWETVRILGAVLDREAEARNPDEARVLRQEVAKADGRTADTQAIVRALDSLFPCP